MRKRTLSQTSGRTVTPGGYWTGAHTTHRLRFHLVFIPKYRRRVLTEPVASRLTELLRQACDVNAWGVVEINVQTDHVHLLLQLPPTDCVSDVMQSLKGGTARFLRLEFPGLREFLWGSSFWADGCFAETVGQQEEAVVRDYIRNQDTRDLRRVGQNAKHKRPQTR